MRQQQFLNVVSRDEAAARFRRHLKLEPLGSEPVALHAALQRTLAEDVASPVDVPGFDRSNVDGFAVVAADTFGASEEEVHRVQWNAETLSPGVEPRLAVTPGSATPIATGAMVPRGADAVVMLEYTDVAGTAGDQLLEIRRAVTTGENISFAGGDIALGLTVLRQGQLLTSREIGVLAAIGLSEVPVYRRPCVAVVSTGDEIVPPGETRPLGSVYDSNLAILCAAISECGAAPVPLGIVADDEDRLMDVVGRGLQYDAVILSGGTSKGAGDISYRVVSRLEDPGVVAHGVALKPGKPVCLAVTDGKPVVILPGFPTSAIFTFHEFVAPVLRSLAGQPAESRETLPARLPVRINSERGRTEYLLVGLVSAPGGLSAYPMGKGSGSVTTFSLADGFIVIDQHTEIIEAGESVDVRLLDRRLCPADLVVIGSHCTGLDDLLGEMQRRGYSTKAMHVGSTGGLAAVRREECDLAGIHLLDPQSGQYNKPFLDDQIELIAGYRRMQAIVFRPGDARFEGRHAQDAVRAAVSDDHCAMINRNAGSGTRILIDKLLQGRRPPGYAVQPNSHNAVAAAVSQHRADWGVAVDTIARSYGLQCLPLQEEHYDFVSPKSRSQRPAVAAFRRLLAEPATREKLRERGFHVE